MAKRPPVHQPAWYKDKKEVNKQYDKQRGTRTARGYNNDWLRAREAWLNIHPLCECCKAYGCQCCADGSGVTAGKVVDHIIPHKGDMKLFWDRSNWQSLCVPCHNSKTARENGIQKYI